MRSLTAITQDIRNPRTKKVYGHVYKKYRRFLGNNKPTVTNADQFIREQTGLQDATLNFYLMTLRRFFRENDITIPKGKLKAVRANNVREDKYVTLAEINKLHRAADGIRDRVIIRVLFHLGLRASELVSLNVGDIDFKNRKVNVKGLKGSHKIRRVRFIRPELVMPTIKTYLLQRGINADNISPKQMKEPLLLSRKKKERLTYSGVRKCILKLSSVIDKPDLSPHWLRHGFCVWNKENGIPPEITAMQIGDTVETTVRIYSHFSESDIDRAYDKLEGIEQEVDPQEEKDPIERVDELEEINKNLEERIDELAAQQTTMNDIIMKITREKHTGEFAKKLHSKA